MALLPLLFLACSSPDGSSGTAAALSAGTADTGLATDGVADEYVAPCSVSSEEGIRVLGADGPAVYQVEACGISCRPAYDSTRRDGDVIFVSCQDGEATVRVVLLR